METEAAAVGTSFRTAASPPAASGGSRRPQHRAPGRRAACLRQPLAQVGLPLAGELALCIRLEVALPQPIQHAMQGLLRCRLLCRPAGPARPLLQGC